jgi:Ca2+-binding RTX toxin-like protein
VAHDTAGNGSAASTSTDNTVTFDITAPTVTINQAASQIDPTHTSPIHFTVVFSASVSDFATGDVTLGGTAGATTATVTGSGTTYDVAVSGMTTSGTVIATLAAGVAHDTAGNGSAASTSTDNTVTFDITAPTVTINQAASQADPTSTSPIHFTVTFSKSVSDFATGDVTLGGTAGATTATVTGSGTTYDVAVSGMTTSGTVIATLAAGVAHDTAGNGSAASTSTDNTVTIAFAAPTVTINQAATQPDPTSSSPIRFTIVFSTSVTGFTGSDVSFAGSTVGGTLVAGVTGSGATYAVSVTGMSGNGTVVASIPAGAAVDSHNTPSAASSSMDNVVTFVTQTQGGPLTCNVMTLNRPGTTGTAVVRDDADHPGERVLIVTGTNLQDSLIIEPRPADLTQVRVKTTGRLLGIFTSSSFQHIVAYGLDGNDTIVIDPRIKQSSIIFGGNGNDYLYGGQGNDQIDGGAGNDHLFGGSGDDTLCGGDGNDYVYGQDGNDVVGGDAGNDHLYGGAGNDELLGGDGNDTLDGGVGNDRLYGQAGNDTLIGGLGNNILVGGDGNDTLVARFGRNILIGGAGIDKIYGNAGDDILIAGSTAHDEDDAALQAILDEWTSADSYEDRVDFIRNGGGANGAFVLDDTTVLDDGLADILVGDGGRDWFWAGSNDKIKDRAANELVN